MEIGSKIIILFEDEFGNAIFDALKPNPSSALRRLDGSYDLPLDHYGIKDRKACFDLFHYVDDKSVYQVTVFHLQNYEPPVLACVINELLGYIKVHTSSMVPTIIIPFLMASLKLKAGSKHVMTYNSSNASIYGLQIGPGTEVTQALAASTQKPPSSLQIQHEALACLIHLVRVVNFPTFLLIGKNEGHHYEKAPGNEVENLYEIGDLLASITSLCFLRDKVIWHPKKTQKDDKEPWRALYG